MSEVNKEENQSVDEYFGKFYLGSQDVPLEDAREKCASTCFGP